MSYFYALILRPAPGSQVCSVIELSLRKRAALILLIVPTFEMIANYPSTYYYVMLGGSLLMFLLAFFLTKVRAAPRAPRLAHAHTKFRAITYTASHSLHPV